MARIKRYASGGLLLDIGAGTGMFMKWAKDSGFAVEGLELSKDAAEYGSKQWGLAIRQGDLHKTIFPPNRYDVVTLSHVFEHLREPRAASRKLYEITKPGGLLVIAVPNFASMQARFFGKRWYHLDVPRHLFHYTPRSLRTLLEETGFKTIGLSFFSPEHNWAGILGSIMRLNAPDERFMHKAVRKLVGVPAARAAAFVEAAFGHGGTFEIYARK
jgi:predicted SAM-dependent methyltransferase